jgi:hypothetical protein
MKWEGSVLKLGRVIVAEVWDNTPFEPRGSDTVWKVGLKLSGVRLTKKSHPTKELAKLAAEKGVIFWLELAGLKVDDHA